MAVENKYVNSDVAVDKKAIPAFQNGGEVVEVVSIVTVAAADDDASVYRVARVNAKMVPVEIRITNTAVTGGTDYELGIYNTLDGPLAGAVKDLDALLGTTTMASARAEGSGISGLSAVSQANSQQRLFELAGDTESDHPSEYDIALTANTVGTAAGTIVVKARFVQG